MKPMTRVKELADRLEAAEAEVERLEAELKAAKATHREIQCVLLPSALDDMGISPKEKIALADGRGLEYVGGVSARVSKENMPGFIAWCDENGCGGLVNREVRVSFSARDTQRAKALAAQLQEQGLVAAFDGDVHWKTLDKWATSRLEQGDAIPADLMNVHELKAVKIRGAREESAGGQ